MEGVAPQQQEQPLRPRVVNACEACRFAKVRCQASLQLGICKRCLESKRECIYKTGPRTRRPRVKVNHDAAAEPRPPPPNGPSKTFIIDIPVVTGDEMAENFEILAGTHENLLDGLVPGDEDEQSSAYGSDMDGALDFGQNPTPPAASTVGSTMSHASSLPMGASALHTPPPSSAAANMARPPRASTRSVASIGLQPQFNVDSAAALLETFKKVMLPYFPCVKLPRDEGVGQAEDKQADISVAGLARSRPFVLLAVLAAASGSRTLQGHSLYDEEFRKILGLKFVAGGERSLELLQGLLLYVAWYPFHLRPKNKQAFQYVRMAVDVVQDLDLEVDHSVVHTEERLEEMRTYLATYYVVCNFATTWDRTPSLEFTEYTSRCCDVLEQHSAETGYLGDSILAWHVRLQHVCEEVNKMRREQRGHSQREHHNAIYLTGLESQLTEWERRMAPDVAKTPSLRIAVLSTRYFLSGAPLLRLQSVKLPVPDPSSSFCADPERLAAVLPTLRALYDYFLTLPAAEFNAFSGMMWSAFIHSVILGFRLSFPLVLCPQWDAAAARQALPFHDYLDRLCRMGAFPGAADGAIDGDEIRESLASPAPVTPGGGPVARRTMDVLSASKVVVGVVRNKFRKRLVRLTRPPHHSSMTHRPVMSVMSVMPAMPTTLGVADATMVSPLDTVYTSSHRGSIGMDSSMADYSPMTASNPQTFSGCPIMDGSLEQYYPYWDETLTGASVAAMLTPNMQNPMAAATDPLFGAFQAQQLHGQQLQGQQLQGQQLHGLWGTMTMEWAQQDTVFDAM